MPNETRKKASSTADLLAGLDVDQRARALADKDVPYVELTLGARGNAEFAASRGHDEITRTLTLQEAHVTPLDEGKKDRFVAKDGELFLKYLDGAMTDSNAKLVFHPVADTQDGKNVAPIQDTTVGFNANWNNGFRQFNATQAFKDNQNANLAITHNQNGWLAFFGSTANPLGNEDKNGRLDRVTGDIQFEFADDRNTGISKTELKFGVYAERAKSKHEKSTENVAAHREGRKTEYWNCGESGVVYRFVAGIAGRSDGASGIIDTSLRLNQTDTSEINGSREVERRSCEFNLSCIIAQHGADYPSGLNFRGTWERDKTRSALENGSDTVVQQSRAVDAIRMEILADAYGKYRLGVGYGRSWEAGAGEPKKELNCTSYFDLDRGRADYGIHIQLKLPWWGEETSYNSIPETPVRKSQLPATERWNNTADVQTGLAFAEAQRPFKDSALDRYLAAVKEGDSALADQLASQFAQSPEGQRMAQQGDRLLELGQAQDQAQVLRGPVMRI